MEELYADLPKFLSFRNDYYSDQWVTLTFDSLLKWIELNQVGKISSLNVPVFLLFNESWIVPGLKVFLTKVANSHTFQCVLPSFLLLSGVYLGVRTCEVFLCFVTIMFVLSIVLTSLFSLFYVTREGNRFLHRG